MVRPVNSYALLLIASIAVSCSAYADIGRVGGLGRTGSPVVPSNLPKHPPQDDATSGQDDNGGTDDTKNTSKERPLLLDIEFNRNRVNFQPALKQAIIENERDSPGTVYQVVSDIPNNSDSPSKAERLNAVYAANLNAVVEQMLALGLPQNRIQTSTVYKDDDSSQDIEIYGATPQ